MVLEMDRLRVIQESSEGAPSKIKTVLAIAAGKGGVGKSTVSVNLALVLRDRGFKVGILDADVYGPSLEQMLPEGMQPAVDPQNEKRLLPAMTFGMPFISVAHFKKKASIVRAPIANGIIEQFLDTVEWGELDFLLIDFPPGTGDIQLTLMQKGMISAAVMVTTPQAVALLDVRKAAELFNQMQIPVLGVIENMSFFIDPSSKERFTPFGVGGGRRLAKELSLPFLGEIPIDPLISEVGDLGESLFEREPGAPGASAFFEIASKIVEASNTLPIPQVEVRLKDPQYLEIRLENRWLPISLQDIQNRCPCARCSEEKKVDSKVSLLEFSSVGRYAISIVFSSGCSKGIYPFSLLSELASI